MLTKEQLRARRAIYEAIAIDEAERERCAARGFAIGLVFGAAMWTTGLVVWWLVVRR